MEYHPISREIKSLYKRIQESQKEIQRIQEECTHPEYFVGMFEWRLASMHPSRICKICDKPLPGITPKEEKECWDEYNREMQNLIY